jgi:hypothetical protein
MGQRKPKPPAQPTRDNAQRFPKPDAVVAERGAPTHEQAHGKQPPSASAANSNDRAHGYTQDSGYPSSGGQVVEAAERGEAEGRDAPPHAVVGSGNGHASTDAEIGSAVRQRLTSEPPPRSGRLLVTVGDGVVTLSGEVDDQIERDRLLNLVRDVGSVREVRDRLQVRKATRGSD